jgi:cyclohexanone monooxygenase
MPIIGPEQEFDAVVIGAGFAGLHMLHRLNERGFRAIAFEAGSGVGGTWFWNRYPGARCDVKSLDYSYTFSDELSQDWDWSEIYAPQPEILAYLEHAAERFDLHRSLVLNARVTGATWDEDSDRWTVRTDRGDRATARFLISAAGSLSRPNVPDLPGLESFQGRTFFTGEWPHEGVDFTGRRVAVLGTGSSGVQVIPMIALEAAQLTVLQRTAAFVVPAQNRLMSPHQAAEVKARYPEHRAAQWANPTGTSAPLSQISALSVTPEERTATFAKAWEEGGFAILFTFSDLLTNREANAYLQEFVRGKVREIVHDPAIADRLSPRGYYMGVKRICVGTNYYETYNRDNVELISLRDTAVEALTPNGLRLAGREIEVDDFVFATGYDAVTGPLLSMDIRGVDGARLTDRWRGGPETYLGLMTVDFPNFFMITGPKSPGVMVNVVLAGEQHGNWIANCLEYLRNQDLSRIEPEPAAEGDWSQHNDEVASHTLYMETDCWYVGANIEGKPRKLLTYVGGLIAYSEICDDVARDGYRGFRLTPNQAAARAGDYREKIKVTDTELAAVSNPPQ